MSFEVELKFSLEDHAELMRRLEAMPGTKVHARVRQVDRYFNHPSRDFGETNEALRIRMIGVETRVTYKGPLLDRVAKTRREIELRLADASDGELGEMLTLLGFREVRSVSKTRICVGLQFENREVEIALDDVDGLGQFVELELVTNEADKDDARDCLLRLSSELSLNDSTQRSYLEMLIEQDSV